MNNTLSASVKYKNFVEQLAVKNKEKRDKSVAMLGTKWLLHPANSPTRKSQVYKNTLL